MLELETGWRIHVDYSTDWLFFRIQGAGSEIDQPSVSETVWAHAEQCGVNRLVCEIDDAVLMNSYLIGQLLILHKRSHLEGGTLRVCGLSDNNNRVLDLMQLTDRFPNFSSRENAVMGHHPDNQRYS